MIKHLGITLLVSLLMLGSVGCTSKDVESDDSDAAEATADSSSDASSDSASADDESMTSEGDGLTNDDDIVADLGSDDQSKEAPVDKGTEEADATQDEFADMDKDLAGKDDLGAPPAEAPATDVPPVDDASNQSMAANDSAAVPEPAPGGDSAESAAIIPPVEEPAPRPKASLKKIADAPFERNGVLLNAVYLSRPGDTYKSVSTKIYGSADKAKELKKVNPFLGAKLKVGDKIYYNSPQRPTDNTKLVTLYEDLGMEPEIYVAKAGDNIRPVSKNLLGDTNSWKEVWSTNPSVESKQDLSEGTQLRYWASSDVSAPPQAAAAPPPPPPPPAPDPMPAADDLAANSPPPPPPPQPGDPNAPNAGAAAGAVEPPPPPPPPMPEPPPPPPVAAQGKPKGNAVAEDPMDTIYLGAGAGLVLLAVGLYVVIRKKKSRRQLDFNTSTQTQIE